MQYVKVTESNQKGYIIAKLFTKDKLSYILKERKTSSIKGQKTRFFLTLPNHKYFSSLFESQNYKEVAPTNYFDLLENKTYYLDYKGNNYTLVLSHSSAELCKREAK